MSAQLPYLEIRGPDGQKKDPAQIKGDQFSIGRAEDINDLALEPDPQQLVTRHAHCFIERTSGSWRVVDNGSVNGVLLRRGDGTQVVSGSAPLEPDDAILILGKLSEGGEPAYWELTFGDPGKTQHAAIAPMGSPYIHYDWIQARLFRMEGGRQDEIRELPPMEHKLIRYMDQRNRANGGTPVMCTHDELYEAVWGDKAYEHSDSDLVGLVYRLRQKIEEDPSEPRFLQTSKGMGYRLHTRPTP